MATHRRGKQIDNLKSRQHRPRQYPWVHRFAFFISLALIIVAAILWILYGQGPIVQILPTVILTVLGIVIGLFQWLFPVSHTTAELTLSDKENVPKHTAAERQADSKADNHPMHIAVQPALADVQDSGSKLVQHGMKVKCNHIAAPPGKVFDRQEILAEIQRYVTTKDKDIRGIFLWGGRGCGKSLIAKTIAEDCIVADKPLGKRFTHIVWLTFRKEELTTSGITKPYNAHQSKHEIYAEILQVHGQPYLGNKDPLKGAQEALRNAPTLVILDSFEFFLEEREQLDTDVAELLKEVALGSFFLLTSWRDSMEIRSYGYRVINIEPFDTTLAKEYFLYRSQEKSIPLLSEQWDEHVYKEVFETTAGIPLALELFGNYLHGISDVHTALADIKSQDHYLWEYIYKKSLQQLPRDEQRLLVMIMLFKLPLDKKRLREALSFEERRFEWALGRLRHHSLLDMDHDGFYLHDTLREYVMSRGEYSTLIREVEEYFINWAVGIARANTNWEVDSTQANALANDLNNLIAALEILLSRETFDENRLCSFGTTIAHYLHISGRWTESEYFLKELLGKMTKDVCKISVQVLLGRHYAHQENIDRAESCLRSAMEMAENIGDETLQAQVCLRLGQTYHRIDSEKALEYLKKARDKAPMNSNYDGSRTRISALSYMAEIQIIDKKSKEALDLLNEADHDLASLGWDRVRAHHARLKADAYLLIGDTAKAREFYNESRCLSENGADGRLLAWNYLGLAELDHNLEYAKKAWELFETVGLKSQVQRAQEVINELSSIQLTGQKLDIDDIRHGESIH